MFPLNLQPSFGTFCSAGEVYCCNIIPAPECYECGVTNIINLPRYRHTQGQVSTFYN